MAMRQEVKIRDSFLVPAFPEAGHIPALKFPNPLLPFTTRALTNKALFSVYTLLGDLTHNHSLAISPNAWRSQSPIHLLMTPRPPCSSPLRAQPQSHPPTRQPLSGIPQIPQTEDGICLPHLTPQNPCSAPSASCLSKWQSFAQ